MASSQQERMNCTRGGGFVTVCRSAYLAVYLFVAVHVSVVVGVYARYCVGDEFAVAVVAGSRAR